MSKKPHKKYDCPCTDCQKWYSARVAELEEELDARTRLSQSQDERLGELEGAIDAILKDAEE